MWFYTHPSLSNAILLKIPMHKLKTGYPNAISKNRKLHNAKLFLSFAAVDKVLHNATMPGHRYVVLDVMEFTFHAQSAELAAVDLMLHEVPILTPELFRIFLM